MAPLAGPRRVGGGPLRRRAQPGWRPPRAQLEVPAHFSSPDGGTDRPRRRADRATHRDPLECDITFPAAQPAVTSTPPREPRKTLRQRGADSFHAALAAVLSTALEDALEQGDHARAVALVNRGFAEGSPQLGCELLCRAMTVVGAARTWTVQMRP